MTKNVINGSCLARSLETQASDSTGFRSFKQIIVELDALRGTSVRGASL